MSSSLQLTSEYKLTVYDAAYLELAMRECHGLATLDKQLETAEKRVGTELI